MSRNKVPPKATSGQRTLGLKKITSVLRRPREPGEVATPMAAMRMNCLSCAGGSLSDVRDCQIRACWLWPYRMGKNPSASAMACELALGFDGINIEADQPGS